MHQSQLGKGLKCFEFFINLEKFDQSLEYKLNETFQNETFRDNFMCKVNSRNMKHEICSELTIKTPERRHWGRSGVFIVNFEHVSHLVLVFLLLTLSRQMPTESLICCSEAVARRYSVKKVFLKILQYL